METWIPEVSPDKTGCASCWCSVLNLQIVAVPAAQQWFTCPPSPTEDGDHRPDVIPFARLCFLGDAAAGRWTRRHSSQTERFRWREGRSSHIRSPQLSVRLCAAATGQRNTVPAWCLCTETNITTRVLFLFMTFSLRVEGKDGLTGVWGRYALGEHAVRDDVEHAERKHHGDDGETQLEHSLHISLWRWQNTWLNCSTSLLTPVVRGTRAPHAFHRMLMKLKKLSSRQIWGC